MTLKRENLQLKREGAKVLNICKNQVSAQTWP